MNRKQICKCYLNIGERFLYGISNGDGVYLLEDGHLGREQDSDFVHPGTITIRPERTRNVPKEIREILENQFGSFREYLRLTDHIKMLQEDKKRVERILSATKTKIDQAKGILPDYRFCEIFTEHLSDKIRGELSSHTQNGYYGEEGEWKVEYLSYVQMLQISRSVNIQKYVKEGSFDFIDAEYDGCLFVSDTYSSDYQKLIKNYHRTLSASGKYKFSEGLAIGDKNMLSYYAEYNVPCELTLTESNAVKLAKLFSAQ